MSSRNMDKASEKVSICFRTTVLSMITLWSSGWRGPPITAMNGSQSVSVNVLSEVAACKYNNINCHLIHQHMHTCMYANSWLACFSTVHSTFQLHVHIWRKRKIQESREEANLKVSVEHICTFSKVQGKASNSSGLLQDMHVFNNSKFSLVRVKKTANLIFN